MKTFETARDVITNARELHCLAGKLYQKLLENMEDERAKMLLDYLAEHEKKMEKNLFHYESCTSKKVLDTWMQYTLEETPRSLIDTLSISNNMSVNDVADMGHAVDSYFVDLFEGITNTAATDELRDIFCCLMKIEIEEKHTLTRATNSLWEL